MLKTMHSNGQKNPRIFQDFRFSSNLSATVKVSIYPCFFILRKNINYSFKQRITTAMWRILLLVTLLLALVITAYYGYSGLLWLFNWMNEVKVLRQRRRYPQIWSNLSLYFWVGVGRQGGSCIEINQ